MLVNMMSDLDRLYEGYHQVGFAYRVIDGRHLIGMCGNLDTIHDGLIEVKKHDSTGEEASLVAQFITDALNAKLGIKS